MIPLTASIATPKQAGVRSCISLLAEGAQGQPVSAAAIAAQLVGPAARDDAAREALCALHRGVLRNTWHEVGRAAQRNPCLGTALTLLLQVWFSLPCSVAYVTAVRVHMQSTSEKRLFDMC